MKDETKKIDWKTILQFVVNLIELIIATFFGASLAGHFNIF